MGEERPRIHNKLEIMGYYGYKGFYGNLKFYLRFIVGRMLQTLALVAPMPQLVVALHRLRGVNIGKNVFIGQGVHMDSLYPALITIEDYVTIAVGSMIFTHSQPGYSIEMKKNYHPTRIAATTIKRGAWVAAGAIILEGVTIGENSIVAAGSVVTKDVEAYTCVAGNPAELIKRIEWET